MTLAETRTKAPQPLKSITADQITNSSELVAIARETRLSAQRFAQTVSRFSAEMPDHLDRFHEAMMAFRTTAHALRS
jgi:hypothetical protein